MMREIDTEQPVVWPEWCYNTTGESRTTSGSPSSSGDQKGCAVMTATTMSHTGNGRSAASPLSLSSSSSLAPGMTSNGPLASALNGGVGGGAAGHQNMGLSFLTSQMLIKLAQQQQQQQNYRPPPSSNGNVTQHHPGQKRKHLDSAVALLSDRLSPSTPNHNNNNNSYSVNNLNLEKLAQRLNNGQSTPEETSYLLKNLTAKEVNTSSGSIGRASPSSISSNSHQTAAAIKSERISPINFNNGKAAANGGRSTAAAGRSRSSTPSSSSAVVFNSPATSSGNGNGIANNGSSNGTLGLNGTGHRNGSTNSSSNSLGELSLSRPSHQLQHHQQSQPHHQLSNHHHHQAFSQQQQQSLHQSQESRAAVGGSSLAENLQQSMGRQVEPQQARNYSDMIRSLAAKYNNNSNDSGPHNGHLISPNTTGAVGGASQQRFSGSSNSKLTKERETEAMVASSMSSAALRLLNSNQGNAIKRSRSPATATSSSTSSAAQSNKASMTMNNPSLAASLDHSTATAGQSSLISSFLTGLPASMFTPMIDMTSTQALVTLARAAKEAEFLNLLSSSSASSAAGAAAATAAASSTSSLSAGSSPPTNGRATLTAAAAARKRLQTTRNVLNATATNQKSSSRPNATAAAALLVNGGFPGSSGGSPTTASTLPPPPPPPGFNSSLLAAAAAASSGNSVIKGRATSPQQPTNDQPMGAPHAAPLDLSAGPQQQSSRLMMMALMEERPLKRIKIEQQHLSPSSSPGPDSGIGGGRDASGASSSDSESPVRRSEESLSPRQSMEKWTPGCNHLTELAEMRSWTVEQVCEFVRTIDICADYAKNFRDQSIDGTGLPLLTEEHLRNLLSMKLGPALKLKAILASRMGTQCQKCGGNQNVNIPAAASSPSPSPVNGADSRRMSVTNGRRSESPQAARSESFSTSFRTKMEALSPIYNSEAPSQCEGVITTVTMTATTAAGGGGRSTPNENGSIKVESAAANGKTLDLLSAER